MHTRANTARPSRLPRRLLTAVGAAAVIPLTIAPLAPALAVDGLTTETSASEVTTPEVATPEAPTTDAPADSAKAGFSPNLAATSPETELPAPEAAPESAPATSLEPAATPTTNGAAPDPAPEIVEPLALAATGPAVTANRGTPPASGWYQTRQPVRFVAEDAGAGVRSITVVVDDTTTERAGRDTTVYMEGNGNHTVEYWATDDNGRNGEQHTLFMAIDGAAPRLATSAPKVISQGARVELGLSCWDEHSGVQTCYATGTDDGVLPSDELGEHSVTLHSRDNAGNETHEALTYRVEPRAAQVPELQFNIAPEPTSGWYRGPVGVIVSATTTDADDRITGVHWATRGPITGSGSVIDENGIAFTIEGDGVTQVSYTATTARGGVGRGEATVRIDGVQPEVRFELPGAPGARAAGVTRANGLIDTAGTARSSSTAPKVTIGSTERVAFHCSDAHSGVDFCGEELPLVASDGTLALDTGTLGTKRLVVEAADVAGNRTKATFEYEVVAAGTGGSGSGGSGGSGSSGGDSTGGSSGDSSGKPPVGPGSTPAPAASHAPSNRTERLAQTGFSWAPLGAIGVAAAAAGAAIALMRFREKDQ